MIDKQPYVRFFVNDWLGGTRGMRASEIGVYITLIMLMYDRQAPLQEDHKRLSRQCGCSPKTFLNALEMLVDDGKVQRLENGLWNKKVAKEFDFRAKKSEKNSEAAKNRWEKHNKNNEGVMQTQCERNANAMLTRAVTSDTDIKEVANATSTRAREIETEFHETFWPAYPHKVAKPDALKAFGAARKRAELSEIMDGLERYKASKPPDRNWCNPGTFLRQDRWGDVPAANGGAERRAPPSNGLKEAFAETRRKLGVETDEQRPYDKTIDITPNA